MVDVGGHGDGVIAWFEDKVVQVGVAHWLAGDGEVQGYVALLHVRLVVIGKGIWLVGWGSYHGDGHHGGVGDVHSAIHIAAIHGLEHDMELCDVEALELIQTCICI